MNKDQLDNYAKQLCESQEELNKDKIFPDISSPYTDEKLVEIYNYLYEKNKDLPFVPLVAVVKKDNEFVNDVHGIDLRDKNSTLSVLRKIANTDGFQFFTFTLEGWNWLKENNYAIDVKINNSYYNGILNERNYK